MSKATLSFLISLTMVFTAFAEVGPVNPLPEDGGFTPYADPLFSPGGTDVVSWTQQADALLTFRRAASGVLGNYFYCFGEQYSSIGQAYNLTTQLWEASTAPPLGNCNWHGVATNDAIYIVGRYLSGYYPEVQKFTPIGGGPTGTWTTVANYPQSLCGIAAAWDGGDLIYAAGGSTTLLNAYVYTISGDMWTPIADLPSAQRYCGGAFVNGKFYCVTGYNSAYTLHEYDPVGNTWAVKAAPPEALYFTTFATTFNEDYIFVLGGGQGGSWPNTDAVLTYDPAADTWVYETPLLDPIGVQAARYVDNGMVVSAGGYSSLAASDVGWTYEGTGFPIGAAPSFTVTLNYISGSPIPAGGGTLLFGVILTNNETSPQNFDLWIEIPPQITPPSVPNRNLTFPAGFTINRPDQQWVIPGTWPTGNYEMVWNIGDMSTWTVWASDMFDFVKSADDDGSGYVLWEVDYDPLDGLFEGLDFGESVVSEFALLGSYPNPFNPSTTISYTLDNANSVKLAVYDLSGREVATLVDGYREIGTHEVTFDASGLASGVYVYRLTSGMKVASGKMVLMK